MMINILFTFLSSASAADMAPAVLSLSCQNVIHGILALADGYPSATADAKKNIEISRPKILKSVKGNAGVHEMLHIAVRTPSLKGSIEVTSAGNACIVDRIDIRSNL